jgi:hypothetical protein
MKTENTTAVGIIIKSNIKIVEGGKIDISTNKYTLYIILYLKENVLSK